MRKAEQPLYVSLEELLCGRILNGGYPLGSFLPSERKLEEELGASRVSIREALRSLQRQGVIEKSVGKRSLVRKLPATKSRNIGFATPLRRESQLEVYRMFFDSLFLLCNQAGHNLFYLDLSGKPTEFLLNLHYDAIFIAGNCGRNAFLKKMLSEDTVAIALDDLDQPLADITVCTDNHDCGKKAAETLVGSGCANVAFMGVGNTYESYHPNRLRLEGFADGLRGLGKPFAEEMRLDLVWPATQDEFAAQLATFLRERPQTDGIFACNDGLAIRTLKALGDQGIKVPAQIAVVGLDGLEMGLYTAPALTTVAQPIHKLIGAAFEKIGGDKQTLRGIGKILIPPSVIIRESTKSLLMEGQSK